MGGNFSGRGPSFSGDQYPGAIPCGKKIPTNRGFGFAAVCAKAVWAGIIASSIGNAKVTPVPCRNVRRERCLFVMNIVYSDSYIGTGKFGGRPLGNSGTVA